MNTERPVARLRARTSYAAAAMSRARAVAARERDRECRVDHESSDRHHRDDERKLRHDPWVAEHAPPRPEAERDPAQQRRETEWDPEHEREHPQDPNLLDDRRGILGRRRANRHGQEPGGITEQADRHHDVRGQHCLTDAQREQSSSCRSRSTFWRRGPTPAAYKMGRDGGAGSGKGQHTRKHETEPGVTATYPFSCFRARGACFRAFVARLGQSSRVSGSMTEDASWRARFSSL